MKKNADNRGMFNCLASLLACAADDERIVPLTFDWIKSHSESTGVSKVLSALLNSSPENSEIIDAAKSWSRNHIEEPGTSFLLSTLIKITPGDEDMRRMAIDWVNSHAETSAAGQLICSLVKAPSSDEESLTLAWTWIDNNGHRPFEQQQLLAAMLRAAPLERRVLERALSFLKGRELDKVPAYLFPALAEVAPSDPEVVSLLSRFIENGKVKEDALELTLNEWLGAPDPTYTAVHAVCRASETYAASGEKLSGVFARCCARNVGVILDAIRLGDARAEDLCYMIERGLPSIDVDPAALIQTYREWPKNGGYHIWKGVLQSKSFQPELFIGPLNEWLDENANTMRYRKVLCDLKLRTTIDPAFGFTLTDRVRRDVNSLEVSLPESRPRLRRKSRWLERRVLKKR